MFEKDNLAGKGAQAIKNVVVDALRRKCKGFAAEPEAKTNCVRVTYANGYHVDLDRAEENYISFSSIFISMFSLVLNSIL